MNLKKLKERVTDLQVKWGASPSDEIAIQVGDGPVMYVSYVFLKEDVSGKTCIVLQALEPKSTL